MRFRGRNVYFINGYPAVTWKDHPVAAAENGGYAYIHRIVGYDKWGDDVFGKHVHHKDEDKSNFDSDNLVLLTPAEHSWQHHTSPVEKTCPICGAKFMVHDIERKHVIGTCCSNKCRGKQREKAVWPELDSLLAMVGDVGYNAVGRILGVSGNAVKKRIQRHSEAKHSK